MSSILLEMLIALLAAVGLLSLSCLLFARWLFPWAEGQDHILALIPAKNSASALDQTVRSLLCLRRWGLFRGQIAVLDCGLDEKGRSLARLLCANTDEVLLYDWQDLPEQFLQEVLLHDRLPHPTTE